MYVAECAPPEVRGLLVGLQRTYQSKYILAIPTEQEIEVAIEFGILISFWIDYGTNYIGGTGATQSEAAWLVPLCLQLAPALVLLVGMAFMVCLYPRATLCHLLTRLPAIHAAVVDPPWSGSGSPQSALHSEGYLSRQRINRVGVS